MKQVRQTCDEEASAAGKQRLEEAKAGFLKMQETLAPFIKKRVIREHSTAGEWCETTELCPPPGAVNGWQ